jgi:hypothetical protein
MTWIALGGLALNLTAAFAVEVNAVFGRGIAIGALVLLAVLLAVLLSAVWREIRLRSSRIALHFVELATMDASFYTVAWLGVLRQDDAMFVAGLWSWRSASSGSASKRPLPADAPESDVREASATVGSA